jgi:hypothetical protein
MPETKKEKWFSLTRNKTLYQLKATFTDKIFDVNTDEDWQDEYYINSKKVASYKFIPTDVFKELCSLVQVYFWGKEYA